MKHEKFTATSSGSQMAYGILEDSYEDGMDHEQGRELIIRALEAAMERDTASGDGIMVAEITEDDVFQVLDERVFQSHLE
jgi:proteasome beta subunit